MIRRVFVPAWGGPEVLEVRSVPAEPLSPGSVRIRVAAAGVNFADLMMRMGLYPEAPKRPFVPGYEVAGRIVEAGAEVATSRPELITGARVFAVVRFGGYSDEVVVPAAKVNLTPDGWSDAEGAAFAVAHLTAWLALRRMARVAPGDRVLVHGAAGGVGMAATAIAVRAGARVAGTVGDATKADAARAAGAELVLAPAPLDAAALRAWAPGGVDVALEPRGGRALRETVKLLAPGGRAVSFGVSDAAPGTRRNPFRVARALLPFLTLHPLALVERNVGIYGLNVLKLWDEDALLGEAMADLLEGARTGALRPVIDAAFPLERAADAHRRIHERRNVGKVVLTAAGADGATDPREAS